MSERFKIEYQINDSGLTWCAMLYPAGATESQVRGAIPEVLSGRGTIAARIMLSTDDGNTWRALTTWRKIITERHHTATTTNH